MHFWSVNGKVKQRPARRSDVRTRLRQALSIVDEVLSSFHFYCLCYRIIFSVVESPQ